MIGILSGRLKNTLFTAHPGVFRAVRPDRHEMPQRRRCAGGSLVMCVMKSRSGGRSWSSGQRMTLREVSTFGCRRTNVQVPVNAGPIGDVHVGRTADKQQGRFGSGNGLAPVTRKGQLVMFDCAVVPCLPYCPPTLKFILILGILGIIVLRDSARTCCGTWEERQSSGLPSSTVQCCC